MTIYEEIKGLNNNDFNELMSWVIGPERDRRKTAEAEAKAQIEQIQALRDSGVLATPTPYEAFEVGQVYLPHEIVMDGETAYEVVSVTPTSNLPFDSADWAEVEVTQ